MKNILTSWKLSLIGFFAIVVFTFLDLFFDNKITANIVDWGIDISVFLIFFNLIYLLVRKEWKQALNNFIIILFTLSYFIVFSIATFWIYQTRPDRYAEGLTIPDNIDLNIPLDHTIRRIDIAKNSSDFEIYEDFQPGLYQYDVWVNMIDPGVIYLKVFDVTQGNQLSMQRLKERSSLSIFNSTDSLVRFGTTDHFTIYEGDWGQPYAARFEIWYKPNEGKERKLLEKNYKIEGWQR